MKRKQQQQQQQRDGGAQKRPRADCLQLPQDMVVEVLQRLPPCRGGGRLSALRVCRRWRDAGLRAFDPSANNNRALIKAVRGNRPEQVAALLDDRRLDPNQWGVHALSVACGLGRVQVVEVLLAHPRVDLARCNATACLSKAARNRSARLVLMLLNDRRMAVDDTSGLLSMLLGNACESGALDVVRRLLDDPRLPRQGAVDLDSFRWRAVNMAAVALVLERARDTPGGWVKAMISQWLRVWRGDVCNVRFRKRARLRQHMDTVARLLCARITSPYSCPVDDARVHHVLEKSIRLRTQYGIVHAYACGDPHRYMSAFCAAAGRRPPPEVAMTRGTR